MEATKTRPAAEETVMIHHASIGVRNIAKAKTFYDAALQPLGY